MGVGPDHFVDVTGAWRARGGGVQRAGRSGAGGGNDGTPNRMLRGTVRGSERSQCRALLARGDMSIRPASQVRQPLPSGLRVAVGWAFNASPDSCLGPQATV